MQSIVRCSVRILILLCLGAASTNSFAVGFRLPETSIAGLALSNALVADTETLGVLSYNPAAMSFHDGSNLVAGIMNVHPVTEVAPENGIATDSDGQANILAPNIYYMNGANEQFTWGIGLNAPFGLETRWPASTFQTFSDIGTLISNPLIAALEPENSKLKMANLNPNLAFQLGDNTSLAVGLDYYLVKELVFNTQGIDINGDGNGLGWNIGLQHIQNDWSFGLAYRSSVMVDIDGTVDATSVGALKSDASAELEFPSMLQLGVRYQVNPEVAVELDIEHTGWSSFGVIEIEHTSGLPSPISSTNEWQDTTAYRLGARYQISPATQLRFGYARENSPEEGDYTSARMPTNDLQTFSLGFAHEVGNLTIEAGYMYALFDEFEHDAPAGSYLAGIGGGNTDPNGTDAYNGKYDTTAHLVGVGISAQF